MTFLEECRKAGDEDRAGKPKPTGKLKIAAATIFSTPNDAFAKQLKRQQQQFDTLMGKVQSMITTLQTHTAQATSTFRQGNPSFGMGGEPGLPLIIMVGEEDQEVGAFLHNLDGGGSPNHRDPTPSLVLHIPSRSRGMSKLMLTINVGSVGKWGISRGIALC